MEGLFSSELPAERWVGGIIENFTWPVIGLGVFGDAGLIELLGAATHAPEFIADQQLLVERTPDRNYCLGLPDDAFRWGVRFLQEIPKEVRALICDKKARRKAGLVNFKDYRAYPKALGVSLATVITTKLGVTEPMAIGIATLVLLTLAQVTTDTFCKMTDEQVVETIKSKDPKKPRKA